MILDLSHPIHPGMPLYPGTPEPSLAPLATPEPDGYAESLLSLSTHAGTHLDAPAHLLPGREGVLDLPVERFIGPALAADLRGRGPCLTPADLEPFLPLLADKEFLILRTGWGERWGTGDYFTGYPVLSAEAARLLALFPLKGLGVDAPSVDEPGSRGLPVHRLLLEKGMVIVENLAGLSLLPPEFTFCCLPLPLAGGDGSPVRAAAIY